MSEAPDDPGIARHREAIDALDREILARLSERARHAHAIGAVKAGTGAPTYRPEREAQILARIAAENPGPLPNESVAAIFRQIMAACLALEQKLAIAYLGPPGTFSQAAVGKQFGRFVDAVACTSIDEVFRSVEGGRTQYGVVPVENSTEGAVGRTLDLMCTTPLSICAEINLRVQQNLLSKATAVADVRKVYSHTQSLGQCAEWLAAHLPGVPQVAVASNAEAARIAGGEPGSAAIAGEVAASIYGLNVLAPHIEDESNNTTRFWVVGRQQPSPSGRDKTSLVMSALNRPGAVYQLLEPLSRHGVSMTRLESRPARTGLWEYVFFVDIAGHAQDPAVVRALAELGERAPFLKLLGSYPAAIA
jgi:chorismate mutase/prephenate dehydratase